MTSLPKYIYAYAPVRAFLSSVVSPLKPVRSLQAISCSMVIGDGPIPPRDSPNLSTWLEMTDTETSSTLALSQAGKAS